MATINNLKLQQASLLLLILIEGFVTISAEILTIRQLSPQVGNSVIVTSVIIGFFLLFLAYGYLRGGKRTGDYAEILKLNFVIAALILGVGLSYSFINAFFWYIANTFAINHTLILVGYLSIITAPLVYILGQTVPIAMNLYKAEVVYTSNESNQSPHSKLKSEGYIGGTVLHLSTLGSFLGAVLTTLLLMNTIGVAKTVFVNYCLLLGLMIMLMLITKVNSWLLALAVLSMPFVHIFNMTMENNYFLHTNAYANYSVHPNVALQDGKLGNVLEINKYHGSFVDYKTGSGFAYIEQIKKILFTDWQLTGADILVLGAGGFSLSAAGDFGNHIIYVDIDKDIANIVRQNFLPQINGEFVVADAREFLQTSKSKYKVILSDVYSAPDVIPAHLITREYFALVADKLEDDGMAIFNVIAHARLQDTYSRRVDNTIRSVFESCMVAPNNYVGNRTNIIYTCNKPRSNKSTGAGSVDAESTSAKIVEIYTDNLNQAATDIFKAW